MPVPASLSDFVNKALNEKIAKMQAEIDGLKKQMSQLVNFVKQKLK